MRPPVLFIHGVSSNGGHFSGWLNIFANAGFECSAPSLPGHSPFDRAALARLTLSDYLAALKSEAMRLRAPPVIIGHSMGGLLAQQLAASIDCRALVCVASAAPWAMLPSQIRALRFLLPMMTAIIPGRVIEPTQAAIRYLALHGLPEEEQRDLLPTFGGVRPSLSRHRLRHGTVARQAVSRTGLVLERLCGSNHLASNVGRNRPLLWCAT